LIIDSIIYRFFGFGFERVRGAASDEDVVFGETVKGNRMSEPRLTIVFRSGNDASCMSGGCDMPAVEGSTTWFPAFAAPAGDTRQLYGDALSLAIGVSLDHAAVRSDYDDCPSYQLRTDLL